MSDISLTASMRSNLLSLQSTQSLMDMTQERLSTGKKVNSAIDNPSSYYTAQSLNNRASDLSSLLDSMGQGVQTIKAANEAIESITSFAQQAKSLANSARDVANNMKTKITTTKAVNGDDAVAAGNLYVDTRADKSSTTVAFTAGTPAGTDGTGKSSLEIELLVDGNVKKVTVESSDKKGTMTAQNVADAIKDQTGLTVDVATNDLTITAADGGSVAVLKATFAANGSGATGTTLAATAGVANVAITAGTVDSAIAEINANANINASIDATSGKLTITATDAAKTAGTNISLAITGDAGKTLSGLSGKIDTTVTDENAIAQRNKYVDQFNAVLEQIDQLAKDAGYKGINLLQENDLKVIFNEDRSSSIDVKGVDASSKGLGLEEVAHGSWNMDADIDTTITSVDNAISELRSMASDFGNNYSIVQNREDFTENLVNVLTEGADKLTLADMNEESANMLALQTRQQLAINSLSLASQAAQSVLKLF